MSQPPLSQQIQIWNSRLAPIPRTNRSVALTSAGKQFLADSRQILGWLMKPPPGLSACVWKKQGNCVLALRRRAVYQSRFGYVISVSSKLTRQCICKPAK
ncbi:hypothetical protein ACNKHK_10265 [Shigella flexneri]